MIETLTALPQCVTCETDSASLLGRVQRSAHAANTETLRLVPGARPRRRGSVARATRRAGQFRSRRELAGHCAGQFRHLGAVVCLAMFTSGVKIARRALRAARDRLVARAVRYGERCRESWVNLRNHISFQRNAARAARSAQSACPSPRRPRPRSPPPRPPLAIPAAPCFPRPPRSSICAGCPPARGARPFGGGLEPSPGRGSSRSRTLRRGLRRGSPLPRPPPPRRSRGFVRGAVSRGARGSRA